MTPPSEALSEPKPRYRCFFRTHYTSEIDGRTSFVKLARPRDSEFRRQSIGSAPPGQTFVAAPGVRSHPLACTPLSRPRPLHSGGTQSGHAPRYPRPDTRPLRTRTKSRGQAALSRGNIDLHRIPMRDDVSHDLRTSRRRPRPVPDHSRDTGYCAGRDITLCTGGRRLRSLRPSSRRGLASRLYRHCRDRPLSELPGADRSILSEGASPRSVGSQPIRPSHPSPSRSSSRSWRLSSSVSLRRKGSENIP
jgi:hypothetical protein